MESSSEISSSSSQLQTHPLVIHAPPQAQAKSSDPKEGLKHDLLSVEDQGISEESAVAQVKKNLITLPKAFIIFGKKLGNGAFGIVYQGEYRGMPVAIKEVDPRKAGKGVDIPLADILQAFEWEVSRLSTLSHPNLVHFYGVCENEERNACLVMELCQKDTLEKRLIHARAEKLGIVLADSKKPVAPVNPDPDEPHVYDQDYEEEEEKEVSHSTYDPHEEEEVSHSTYDQHDLDSSLPQPKPKSQPKTLTEPPLPLSEIWRIAIEMAYGLAYLHQKGTLHRDLKSENILFGSKGRVKLADLGVAQVDALISSEQAKVVEQGMKDFRYAAPEEFEKQSTPMCDMYSYGLILWELVTGEIVPSHHTPWRKAGKTEVIPDYCPPSLRALIEHCWLVDPQKRPTAQQAIAELEAVAADYTDQPAKACLLPQITELLEEQRAAIREYIPSNVAPPKEQSPDEKQEAISIQTQLQAFMASPTPVCVVIGVGGLGKSLAGYVLADTLLQHPDPHTALPILIRPGISAWRHTALKHGIETALTHYRISPEGIQQLKQIPVLFIFDGYDELSGESHGNLPSQLGLDHWPHAKLLISVRPGAVAEDKLIQTFGLNGQGICYTLQPLGAEQIHTYLDHALPPEDAKALKAKLPNNLKQTLTNPFVLSLFCKSWESQNQQVLQTLTQSEIYRIAIEHWIQTSADQLPAPIQQQLASNVPLLAAAQSWLYRTAFAMAAGKTLSLVPIDHPWNQLTLMLNQYAATTLADRDQRIAALPPQEAAKAKRRVLLTLDSYQRLLQTKAQQFFALCPLKDRNGQLHFLHKTLWEYTVAAGIVQALSHPTDQPQAVSATQIHPRWMLSDRGILTFLQAISRPQDWAQWEGWIEASKDNLSAAQPAACAITALNGLQRGLMYRDFRGIRIPEADLRGSYLDESDLSRADLSQALLENVSLNGTCLTQVNGLGIRWGQRPSLSFEHSVQCIVLHPNGPWLAAGLENGTIVLQSFQTHQIVRIFKGHTSYVTSVAFSSSGEWLVSGSNDETVRLWQVATGKRRYTLTGHTSSITSVVFSPSGELLASAGEDHVVRLWQVATGKCRFTLTGHTSIVAGVAFSPSGEWLVSGSEDHTVRLWQVATGKCRHILTGHAKRVTSVAFSPSGDLLASGSNDRTVRLWQVATGKCRHILTGHTSYVTSVAFSPSGEGLASGSGDQTVRLWQVTTGQLRHTLTGHTREIKSVVFSPSGEELASGGWDRTVRLWQVAMEEARHTLIGHTNWVTSMAFNPSGEWLASGSDDHTLRLWQVATGQLCHTLIGHTKQVTSVVFSPSGEELASGSNDETVRLWHVATGQLSHTLAGHTKQVTSVAFSPSEGLLASGSRDKTICLWQIATGQIHHTMTGHAREITSVTFSPSGELLASGSWDRTVCLWQVATGQRRHILTGHIREVTSVAFSPSGEKLASGSWDQTVRLWHVATGQLSRTMTGHTRWVTSVAFSSSRDLVASGSYDHTVRLWAPNSGQCLKVLTFTEKVSSVSYSPTGQLGVSFDHIVQVWTPPTRWTAAFAEKSTQAPVYRLTWTSAPCERLVAKGCDIQGVRGLTEMDIALLEQFGAIGKPAQASRRSTEIEKIVEPVERPHRKEPQSVVPLLSPVAQGSSPPPVEYELQSTSSSKRGIQRRLFTRQGSSFFAPPSGNSERAPLLPDATGINRSGTAGGYSSKCCTFL